MKYEDVYNKQGFRTKRSNYSLKSVSYDINGNKIHNETFLDGDIQWKDDYKYNDNNDLIHYTHNLIGNVSPVEEFKFEYEYDEKGNPIQIKSSIYKNNMEQFGDIIENEIVYY